MGDAKQKITGPSFFLGKNADNLITFGAGQPDLPPPYEVYDALKKYKSFKYGLIQGEPELREELAKQHSTKPENIIITNGGSEALDLSFAALVKPGEKVLLTQPYYYSYPYFVKFRHAKAEYTKLVQGKIDFDDFDKQIRGCRLALINSPANPTGSVQNVKTLKQIEKLCNDLKIFLLSDEVYSNLVYVGEHYSPKGEYILNINSFSKTFGMCGMRIGYLYSMNGIVKDLVEIKTHTSMNTSLVAQHMAMAAMKTPKSYVEKQLKTWTERRKMIYDGLQELGLSLWNPEGAFYVFPKMKNPEKVVEDLYFKHKVIVYNGEWFGSNDRVRLSYALTKDRIEEGLKRIGKYLEKR